MKIHKRIKRWFNWYIKGTYHCDKCPWCWEEWSYEGDGDCGCYIKGDIQDTCRLLPPFRFLVGWPRKKVNQYHEAHAYDGMVDWYTKDDEKRHAYAESIRILLKDIELYRRSYDGKLIPVCKVDDPYNDSLSDTMFDAYRFYEDKAHPPQQESPLKKQWKNLVKRTWDKFISPIKPYFS